MKRKLHEATESEETVGNSLKLYLRLLVFGRLVKFCLFYSQKNKDKTANSLLRSQSLTSGKAVLILHVCCVLIH